MIDKIKNGFLTGNQLKIIAIILMTVDHVGAYLLPQFIILRIIGRLVMPIFAYMIAEGCTYTRNKKAYLGRLVLFAFICQVVYFIAIGSVKQCILVTFSLSIILIYLIDNLQKKKDVLSAVWLVIGFVGVVGVVKVLPRVINGFSIDYNFWGVMLPVLIYLGKNKGQKLLLTTVGLLLLGRAYGTLQLFALFAVPILAVYNGQRGRARIKYLFYVYYPLHLAVIFLIGRILMGS